LFLLGKLYRIMGHSREATEMFTHARDLNPRLANAIAGMRRRGGGRGGGSDDDDEEEDDDDDDEEEEDDEDGRAGGRMRVRSDMTGSVNGVMLD
jgi:hypothetical protein